MNDQEKSKEGRSEFSAGLPSTALASKLGPGWQRDQVSFWLTAQRRHDLVAIANQLPSGCTPSDALARAIDLARIHLASGSLDPAELMDAVDTSLARGLSETRDSIDTQTLAIADLSQGMKSIHRLLSALADGEDLGPALSGAGLNKPPLFRDWLDNESAKAGGRPTRSAVATGCWHSVERVSERLVAVDFEATLVALDGKRLETTEPSEPSIARFDLLDPSHPFATADWTSKLFFVCQPMANGWMVHLHQAASDGSAGKAIGRSQA